MSTYVGAHNIERSSSSQCFIYNIHTKIYCDQLLSEEYKCNILVWVEMVRKMAPVYFLCLN